MTPGVIVLLIIAALAVLFEVAGCFWLAQFPLCSPVDLGCTGSFLAKTASF
jgi:hypothetical protein